MANKKIMDEHIVQLLKMRAEGLGETDRLRWLHHVGCHVGISAMQNAEKMAARFGMGSRLGSLSPEAVAAKAASTETRLGDSRHLSEESLAARAAEWTAARPAEDGAPEVSDEEVDSPTFFNDALRKLRKLYVKLVYLAEKQPDKGRNVENALKIFDKLEAAEERALAANASRQPEGEELPIDRAIRLRLQTEEAARQEEVSEVGAGEQLRLAVLK